MRDVIVVGAGAAAVGAALELADAGLVPLVLDVGVSPGDDGPRAEGNLYDYRRRHDTFDLQIGAGFEGLGNLLGRRAVPVKLTTPNSTWVTAEAERLAPVDEAGFCAIQSFARGGLANAWGAGLYPFVDEDLRGFPIAAADLERFTRRLTREIGISGTDDDLTPYFGSAEGLGAPVRRSHNIEAIYRRYRKRRATFRRGGMAIGAPRLAVRFEDGGERPSFEYSNTEFWQPSPSIYSPRQTLDRLRREGRVRYEAGLLVRDYSEESGSVTVRARATDDGTERDFTGRFVILAAGAINTARIVLRANRDTTTWLELLENPALQVPLVRPAAIGRPLDTSAFGLVQLNLVWDVPGTDLRLQGSLMELTSPMRAEFFAALPFAARDNVDLLRYLLPAMVLMQLYYPGHAGGRSRLRRTDDDGLRVEGSATPAPLDHAPELLRALRRLGAWSHPRLIVRVPLGHAIHYAGTLPMRAEPDRYQCDPGGRLGSSRRVYVGDSAAFSGLPAKNMSFAMMANAMRVAAEVVRRLGER